MKNFKHLIQQEILAFAKDSLPQREANEIGKHLLQCEICRKLLPLPSVEQFWAAITTEIEPKNEPLTEKSKLNLVSIFSAFSSFLKLQSGLLWGGAVLLIIFSFSFLVWLNVADSSREVVQKFDNESGSELHFPILTLTPTNENPASSANSNRAIVNPTPKISKREVKPKIVQPNSRQDFIKPNLREKKENISAIRGGSANCNEEKNIALEFSGGKDNFVFKWKKVPKAVKYHLYISDDEEILIDEFETASETSFVLKKALDPLKTYKWKLIVTLENGNKVIGASQKFTIKNFQINQMKPEKRNNSEVRCSANA